MHHDALSTPNWQLSERARKLTSSAIRELLKVVERPEVISFAGGLPSPAAFPVAEIRAAADRILRDTPTAALQYSPTEGYLPLREWIAARHSQPGAEVDPSRVLITTGSQQLLYHAPLQPRPDRQNIQNCIATVMPLVNGLSV